MPPNERQPLLHQAGSTDHRISSILLAHSASRNAPASTYPVDHGLIAWLQVLGGFILFANSWGLPNTFGVFQTYYIDTLLPSHSASAISWIGSVQLFFTTLGCLPAGVLVDRGYLRSLIAVGTGLEVVGLLATSWCKSYWGILVAQGVVMGIGSGLLAVIPIVVLAMFFEKRRMVATGLASTGASVAGIAYTLSMRALFTGVGFAWAVRIFAVIILATNGVALAVMRLQMQYGSKELGFGFHHFKDLPYTVFVGAFTLFVASSFVPFFFIQDYALQLGVSKEMAFNLLSFMNAANIFGRFVPNFIADRYGGVNTLIPLSIACIITIAFLPLAQTQGSLIAIGVVYGFLSGGVIIIPGPTITELSPTSTEIGVRLGLAYLIASFGGLLGNPLMGLIKGDGKSAVQNFNGVWFSAAAVMAVAAAALVATRWLKLGSALAVGRV